MAFANAPGGAPIAVSAKPFDPKNQRGSKLLMNTLVCSVGTSMIVGSRICCVLEKILAKFVCGNIERTGNVALFRSRERNLDGSVRPQGCSGTSCRMAAATN